MLFSGLAFTYGSTPYQKICRIRHKKRARLLRTAPLGYDIFILKLPQAALNGMLFHLYLTCRRTFGWTMPHPAISSQRPLSGPLMNATSISADGSVNGKKEGRKRTSRSSLSKKLRRKSAMTPFRSAKLTSSPIQSPSTW